MNNERYLDPPEDNDPTCETCGGEMEDKNQSWKHIRGMDTDWQCCNTHCPNKFDEGTPAHEMAVELVELHETVARLRRKIKGITTNSAPD
jgi:hypothetical protein